MGRNKGPQFTVPQSRTPALEGTTKPGIGEAAQGHNLADTLSPILSPPFATMSSSR